jgi:hypothetical protein
VGVVVFCVSVFFIINQLSVCVGVVCFLLVIVYQHFCFFVLNISEFIRAAYISQVVPLGENDQAAVPSSFRVGKY